MEQRIELAPHCSLAPGAAKLFFAATCLFSLSFSICFVFHGFWPILPFWALEMLTLGLALYASMRRRRYTQTVLGHGVSYLLSLVTRFPARRSNTGVCAALRRRSRLRSPRTRLYPSKLTIDSRGLACEVGSFLTEEERGRLAQRLHVLIGGMNESRRQLIET